MRAGRACFSALGSQGCSPAVGAAAAVPSADPATLRRLPAGEVVGRAGRTAAMPGSACRSPSRRWASCAGARPQPPRAVDRHARGARRRRLAARSSRAPFGGDDTADAGTLVGSEDCLYLERLRAAPSRPASVPTGEARLPVMVWIHGGGNTIGDARLLRRRPARRRRSDVVVVTINYRLGPLGWFRHAALRDGGASAAEALGQLRHARPDPRARVGARQHRGLRRRSRATSRSSASRRAARTCSRCCSRRSRGGLFHRAIVAERRHLRRATLAEAENLATTPVPGHAQQLERAAAAPARDARARRATAQARRPRSPAMAPAEVAALPARAVAGERLLAAYTAEGSERLSTCRSLFADGAVLPARAAPLAHFARRARYNRVPVMLGTNRDENKLFMFFDPQLRAALVRPAAARARSGTLRARRRVPSARLEGQRRRRARRAGCAGAQAASVFVYRFDWDEEPSVLRLRPRRAARRRPRLRDPVRVRPLGSRRRPPASCSTTRASPAARRSSAR